MVDFTEPYYYASIITLVKNDGDYADAASVADLKGVTCTSQQNTIWYDSCLPQIEDANILPAQESAPAMLVGVHRFDRQAAPTELRDYILLYRISFYNSIRKGYGYANSSVGCCRGQAIV